MTARVSLVQFKKYRNGKTKKEIKMLCNGFDFLTVGLQLSRDYFCQLFFLHILSNQKTKVCGLKGLGWGILIVYISVMPFFRNSGVDFAIKPYKKP